MSSTAQNSDWVPALLQISDPLFPTGAYAHSMGLEQWAASCGYQNGEDLIGFFTEHVGPSLARWELPYLRFLRDRFENALIEEAYALEAEIDAFKWASEIREASIAQGRGRLRLLRKLWSEAMEIEAYADAFAAGRVYGHHLSVSALQFNHLKVPEQASLMAYGYQTLANYVSAAVKLLRISPEAAQRALHAGLSELPLWVEHSQGVSHSEAGWFAPAFDITNARHASAFSRLFIS